MALNTRQQLFIEHYLKLNNATQAAIAAGYSARGAGQTAHNLLKNTEIAARISQRTEAAMVAAKMEADEVLQRLAAMARGSMADFIRVAGNGEPAVDLSKQGVPLHLIKRIKTKRSEKFGDETEIELYDAQSALVTLGKHWKLWDRAGETDWKDEVKKLGLSPAELFEQMVRDAATKIKQTRNG